MVKILQVSQLDKNLEQLTVLCRNDTASSASMCSNTTSRFLCCNLHRMAFHNMTFGPGQMLRLPTTPGHVLESGLGDVPQAGGAKQRAKGSAM